MAAYWRTRFTLTFFQQEKPPAFNPNKSLYSNFIAMCSLPLFKSNSPETENLIIALKQHKLALHQGKKLSKREELRLRDAIIGKIETWLIERNLKSSRYQQVGEFYRAVKNQRNDFIKNNPKLSDDEEFWSLPTYQK